MNGRNRHVNREKDNKEEHKRDVRKGLKTENVKKKVKQSRDTPWRRLGGEQL
jgi:hypothetical protein